MNTVYGSGVHICWSCVGTHTHTHMHTHAHAHAHAHTHTHARTHARTHALTHTNTNSCTNSLARLPAFVYAMGRLLVRARHTNIAQHSTAQHSTQHTAHSTHHTPHTTNTSVGSAHASDFHCGVPVLPSASHLLAKLCPEGFSQHPFPVHTHTHTHTHTKNENKTKAPCV